jgi:hypothetical protein
MTAGEHYGQIPPVPKGFVRWVHLRKINEPDARKLTANNDRDVHYIYCGDANVVPDTAGWAPFDGKLAEAMADKRGVVKISAMRPPIQAGQMSVQRCLQENPLLVSAGVTLDDFDFSRWKGFGGATLPSTVPTASPAPTPSHTLSQQPTMAQEALLSRKRPATTPLLARPVGPKLVRTSSKSPPNKGGNRNAALPAGQSALAQFPLTGGALKCDGCGRWHNVPENMMNEVRSPSSERSWCDVIRSVIATHVH